jgi:hypothetical protein
MIKKRKIESFEERAYCDNCGAELLCTHSLPMHPVRYAYYCKGCNKHSTAPHSYPRIAHVPVGVQMSFYGKEEVSTDASPESPKRRRYNAGDLDTAEMNPCQKKESIVHYLEMTEPFEVGVSDADFVEGEAGDYLLRNSYGILSIVPKDIFEKLYTVLRG